MLDVSGNSLTTGAVRQLAKMDWPCQECLYLAESGICLPGICIPAEVLLPCLVWGEEGGSTVSARHPWGGSETFITAGAATALKWV